MNSDLLTFAGRATRLPSHGYRNPNLKHAAQLAFVLAPLLDAPATAVAPHLQRSHLGRRGSSKVELQRPPGLVPQLLQANSLTCLPRIWLDPGCSQSLRLHLSSARKNTTKYDDDYDGVLKRHRFENLLPHLPLHSGFNT